MGTLNEVFPSKSVVQLRRLFGEEGRNEPFVPTGRYTMANDVVSCVKNRDLVLLLLRFKERLVSDVSGELKNVSAACGWHAVTENPAVENSGFLSRLPLLHWIEAKLDRACVLIEPERVRLIEI